MVHQAPKESRVRWVRPVLLVTKAKTDPRVRRVRRVPQGQPDLPVLQAPQVHRVLVGFPGLPDPLEVVVNADHEVCLAPRGGLQKKKTRRRSQRNRRKKHHPLKDSVSFYSLYREQEACDCSLKEKYT